MSDVVLDLGINGIFSDPQLCIDKKITFIFGKNGTGKSTLASLLKKQIVDYDVRCFQGFDDIVGEDKRLNAVILGEENNEIEQQIKHYESEIIKKEDFIREIEKEINKSTENPDNLWKKVDEKKNELNLQKNKINNFYSNSARKIKNLNDPQVSSTSYNTNAFQSEIEKAKLLTKDGIEECRKNLKTDVKKAIEIDFKKIDFDKLLQETNVLLLKKIQEKEIIPEIHGSIEKTRFAENGLSLHSPAEKCSFCGAIISNDRYEKLKKYFSADEVQNFRNQLKEHIDLLNIEIKNIQGIEFNLNNFYSEYIEVLNKTKHDFDEKRNNILRFLNELKNITDNKLKMLFEESKELKMDLPDSFEQEILSYNDIVFKNNSSSLKEMKKLSMNMLRYHEVQVCLKDFNYKNEMEVLSKLEAEFNEKKAIIENENKKVEKLKDEISQLKKEITTLQSKTKNEKILVDEINKKLELYVNFELEYMKEVEKKGHYIVKCKATGEHRNITQLSLGEKNIIAFLYFIQKINEIDNPKSSYSKLIVFDDPMTSNDDAMQYLIIEELDKLIARLADRDKIIIMTHNNHFYLNSKYKYESYRKNIFLRFISNGKQTITIKLNNSDEDFKTNYEALWKELEFIYRNAPSDSMLLNPIRRIIETYTKFNCIKKSDMLSHVSGAEKLFNVNSHSIDDFEAELNGKNRKDILNIMKKCFEEEGALNHFKQYWKIDLDSINDN